MSPISFHSILYEESTDLNKNETIKALDLFRDLNLDQIVDAIIAGREEYNLKPFFHACLSDVAAIAYRHEVMRDLDRRVLFQSVRSFSSQMRKMRQCLTAAEKRYYKYEREWWFVDAVETYCEAVERLLHDLHQASPNSRGLRTFRDYLEQYAESGPFKTLLQEAKQLKSGLAAIRYCLLIKYGSITVRQYDSETDYSVAVEETFSKFQQGAVKDYRVKFTDFSGMNHVEAGVLDLIAKLNPDIFLALDDFCTRNKDFLEKTIVDFDREIQFYVA